MADPTPDLALYMFDGCPYCERVQAALKALGVQVEERNIHLVAEHREALREARGVVTVPVLRITEGSQDHWLPESADIVKYLAQRFGDGTVPRRPWWSALDARWLALGIVGLGAVAPEALRDPIWGVGLLVLGAKQLRSAWRNQQPVQGAVGAAVVFCGLLLAVS